jgi:hypothetical protein
VNLEPRGRLGRDGIGVGLDDEVSCFAGRLTQQRGWNAQGLRDTALGRQRRPGIGAKVGDRPGVKRVGRARGVLDRAVGIVRFVHGLGSALCTASTTALAWMLA